MAISKMTLCSGCGKEMPWGLTMGMPRPKWVRGNLTYWVWALWMKYVRQQSVNRHYHKECAPPGWLSWRIEQSPNMEIYYDSTIETDLMKSISDGLK